MSNLDEDYPPIIYQDIQLANSSAAPQAIFKNVSRNSEIISKADMYCVAIIRLVMPLSSVHNWQPELLLGQNTSPPIQTVYRCVLSFDGTDGPVTYMSLIRARYDQAEPSLPLTAQPTSEWAAVYSQSTVVNMLNQQLLEAFNGLKVALGGTFPGVAVQPQAPFYVFDQATGIMSINGFPCNIYDTTNPGAPNLELWYGAEFLSYLDGYNIRIYSTVPSAGAKDVQLVMSSSAGKFLDSEVSGGVTTWLSPPGNLAAVALPRDDTKAILQCSQQFATPWSFDRALATVQVVSSLPTLQEAADPPVVQLGVITSGTATILMDFAADLSGTLSASTGPILYTASACIPGARFSSLVSGSKIQNFSIGAQWVDSFGVIRPLLASSSQSSSVKLVFVRKDLLKAMS